jgi:uncharacterized membrane protein YoaK (UPF0700 family)
MPSWLPYLVDVGGLIRFIFFTLPLVGVVAGCVALTVQRRRAWPLAGIIANIALFAVFWLLLIALSIGKQVPLGH